MTPNPYLHGTDQGILAKELMTELMGSLPVFSKKKITVGFHGTSCYTDRFYNYVNLPSLPETTIISTNAAREIRGIAMKLSGTLLYETPEDYYSIATPEEQVNVLFALIYQAIEGYRIEREILEIYPGAHKNFTQKEIKLCENYLEIYNKNPDAALDLRYIGPSALKWIGDIDLQYKTIEPNNCLNTLPKSFQSRLWQHFSDIELVESTADTVRVTQKIFADFMSNPIDPNDKPTEEYNIPDYTEVDAKSIFPENLDPQNQSPVGKNASKTQNGSRMTSMTKNDASILNPNTSIVKEIEDKQNDDHGQHLSVAVPSNISNGPQAKVLGNTDGIKKSEEILSNLNGIVNSVSATLRKTLVSVSKDRWKSGRRDGDLDPKKLAGVLLGNLEIYKKKIEGEKIETALSILVDCSGSMSGQNIQICQETSLVLHQALHGTPIKFEILGYTTGDTENLPDQYRIMSKAIQNQTGQNPYIAPIMIYEFKAFDANYQTAMTTIGNMTEIDMGGTPTADAILLAFQRLNQRKEKRHVMFVLTDGDPDDRTRCKNAVEVVEKSGTTVLGMGIQSNAVKTCFKNNIVINNTRDIPAIVLKEVSGILFKDKKNVATKNTDPFSHIKY